MPVEIFWTLRKGYPHDNTSISAHDLDRICNSVAQIRIAERLAKCRELRLVRFGSSAVPGDKQNRQLRMTLSKNACGVEAIYSARHDNVTDNKIEFLLFNGRQSCFAA